MRGTRLVSNSAATTAINMIMIIIFSTLLFNVNAP